MIEGNLVSTIEGRRIIALRRLRAQAVEAHSRQDAATVNHCCAIAFDRISKWTGDSFDCNPTLMETRWAFIFALYWLTDIYMVTPLNLALKKLGGADHDSGVFKLVEITVSLVTQPLNDAVQVHEVLERIDITWMNEHFGEEDRVLVQLCTELCFSRDPWNLGWVGFLERVKPMAPDLQRDALLSLQYRLTAQRTLFYPISVKSNSIVSNREMDMNTRDLIEISSTFLDQDWTKLDSAIQKIVPRTGFGSEDVLPITNLIYQLNHFQMLRWASDDQFVRLTSGLICN